MFFQFFQFPPNTFVSWVAAYVFLRSKLTCLHSSQCLLIAAAAAVGETAGSTDHTPDSADQSFVAFSQRMHSATIVWTDCTSSELFHVSGRGWKNKPDGDSYQCEIICLTSCPAAYTHANSNSSKRPISTLVKVTKQPIKLLLVWLCQVHRDPGDKGNSEGFYRAQEVTHPNLKSITVFWWHLRGWSCWQFYKQIVFTRKDPHNGAFPLHSTKASLVALVFSVFVVI